MVHYRIEHLVDFALFVAGLRIADEMTVIHNRLGCCARYYATIHAILSECAGVNSSRIDIIPGDYVTFSVNAREGVCWIIDLAITRRLERCKPHMPDKFTRRVIELVEPHVEELFSVLVEKNATCGNTTLTWIQHHVATPRDSDATAN